MKPCTVAAKIYNALFPFSDTNMKILAFTLRWEFISAWRLCTYSFSTLMKRQSTCHCSKKKEFLCSICTKMLWAFWMLPPLHIFATFCDNQMEWLCFSFWKYVIYADAPFSFDMVDAPFWWCGFPTKKITFLPLNGTFICASPAASQCLANTLDLYFFSPYL